MQSITCTGMELELNGYGRTILMGAQGWSQRLRGAMLNARRDDLQTHPIRGGQIDTHKVCVNF